MKKWLEDIFGNLRSIKVIERPSAELCLACRARSLLCGKSYCPILIKAKSFLRRVEGVKEKVSGSSPPAIFVGRINYPHVYIGPMSPNYFGDTKILDTPELWLGKDFMEILDYRVSLFRGKVRAKVSEAEEESRLIQNLQEIVLSDDPVDLELYFEKEPTYTLILDDDSQPFGPSAKLKALKVSNPKTDRRVEKVYYDRDLKASDAILKLYRDGVYVSKIQRVLSAGMLGLRGKRKLVPTRWSITAVDDILSKGLLEDIKSFPPINEYRVYSFNYLDNYYVGIFFPENWSFEWIEAWFPKTHWNLYGMEVALLGDYEEYFGKFGYSSVGGCYYACRLAVCEALWREKRQAKVLVLREIHPGYLLPLGVWNVREAIRGMLRGKYEKFNHLKEALNFAFKNLTIPFNKWLKVSHILKQSLYQKRMEEFLDGKF
ncbi:hypothetical protein HRbin06_01121 [archaeon HR06]|nr:hypothetical protein HRbin06_01121 [archaeon HR06]